MPGARGDLAQGHVVEALRHVPEPKMDHLTADKNVQDHQLHPHHATQMIAQVREKLVCILYGLSSARSCTVIFQLIALGAVGDHGAHVQEHVVGAPKDDGEPKIP